MLQLNVDCLVFIFNELLDKKSLHSCLLANREWCRLAVPILWKKYSWSNVDETVCFNKLINTILFFLPSSSKQLLSDNDIKLPSTILSKPPFFNYIDFCKFPKSEVVRKIIGIVLGNFSQQDKKDLFEQVIYKLFVSQCKNVKEVIWQTSQPLSLFPGSSTCFSQLYSLSIDLNYVDSDVLYEMAQICKDLNDLEIRYCSEDLPGLISLIDAQRNLKKVSLYTSIKRRTCEGISRALARKRDTINFLYLNLHSTISPSFLTSLVNLTRISICNEGNYEYIQEINRFQQYLAISEFPNLQSIGVTRLSCYKELAMLIEKTKGNILRVFIDATNRYAQNTGMLIKAIAENCPKIKFLYTYIEPNDFIHVRSLLINCRNLEEVIFDSLNIFINNNIGDELLDNFTKFSPSSLIDITISGDWKYSIDALELFFESCRERTLFNFDIIHNSKNYITECHKAVVRKYVNEGVIKLSNCK
ncbi:hypothetical protein C1645_768448 [Glomus cerebriforme]|uniref:F-box domain-containing protein n=1 Tax=Glomus cerebriforme TaxID=658196 RepID=A0A397T2E2_9GLOM|nr:hypothetical protein C1645_768448 [Glomus cerebriforme]